MGKRRQSRNGPVREKPSTKSNSENSSQMYGKSKGKHKDNLDPRGNTQGTAFSSPQVGPQRNEEEFGIPADRRTGAVEPERSIKTKMMNL
ncbi:MAG: hypothetical protein GY696_38790 [Gammaproteobacteria bacterium]|nr:hypothetical protein [Gammaproteobacteria bacterium]